MKNIANNVFLYEDKDGEKQLICMNDNCEIEIEDSPFYQKENLFYPFQDSYKCELKNVHVSKIGIMKITGVYDVLFNVYPKNRVSYLASYSRIKIKKKNLNRMIKELELEKI